MNPAADELVAGYWEAMNSNDWQAVATEYLATDYICLWPQSNEVLHGREDFFRANAGFPGQGGWRFEIISIVAEANKASSDVRVTHSEIDFVARVITFHHLSGGLISRQTEFWPDPYSVPDWRKGMLTVDPDMARF